MSWLQMCRKVTKDLACLSSFPQVPTKTADWFSFINYSPFNFSLFNYFLSIGLIIDIRSKTLQWSLTQ